MDRGSIPLAFTMKRQISTEICRFSFIRLAASYIDFAVIFATQVVFGYAEFKRRIKYHAVADSTNIDDYFKFGNDNIYIPYIYKMTATGMTDKKFSGKRIGANIALGDTSSAYKTEIPETNIINNDGTFEMQFLIYSSEIVNTASISLLYII